MEDDAAAASPASSQMNFFKPPAAARAAKILDRSLFHQRIPTAAASVFNPRDIAKYRKALDKSQELLRLGGFKTLTEDPDPARAKNGVKCLILDPRVKPNQPETWSSILQEAKNAGAVDIVPLDVDVGYDLWPYLDVVKAILPEELDEPPTGFNTAGHVAHLNIREAYLPYKHIIAQVILDKNGHIQTVINKVDDVGKENEFRTFAYEVLAGPDDMNVEVVESNCVFRFDYSKVYWNTKLAYEHNRICSLFKEGEVVADVMAGIGPFAVPAGKKGIFVWANDKNPESFKYLEQAIKKNKTSEFVRPFCDDGHDFIKTSVDSVLAASKAGEYASVPVKFSRSKGGPRPTPTKVPVPPTVSHFVMNLPASALEFLHDYKGIYHGQELLFSPHTRVELPIVHAHCFAIKADDERPANDILDRIERELGIRLKAGSMYVEGEVNIHWVRNVAPNKVMYCASFRIPKSIAFAARA